MEDDNLTGTLLRDVLIKRGFDVQVVDTTARARRALDEFDPDAALVDIVLGDGPSGIGLAHLISREYPSTAVILLSRYPDFAAAGLSRADVPKNCGFVRKDMVTDTGHLMEAIEGALRDHGDDYRDDLIANGRLSALTPNQRAVLRMVAQGLTNAAIAENRGTTTSAVEQSLSSIFRALGLEHRGDLNPRLQAARLYIAAVGLPEDP